MTDTNLLNHDDRHSHDMTFSLLSSISHLCLILVLFDHWFTMFDSHMEMEEYSVFVYHNFLGSIAYSSVWLQACNLPIVKTSLSCIALNPEKVVVVWNGRHGLYLVVVLPRARDPPKEDWEYFRPKVYLWRHFFHDHKKFLHLLEMLPRCTWHLYCSLILFHVTFSSNFSKYLWRAFQKEDQKERCGS